MAYNTRKRVRDAVDTEDTSPEGTDNPSSPAKRIRQKKPVEKSKVTTTRVRRKGSLQELPKMPLDIIDEILTHMHLGDLLSLSRTTKAFRELVLARSAERFWKAAMENSLAEDLPACPEWLSEPAYANLMYSPHCHSCLSGNVQSVFFVWGVRYCKKCQEALLIEDQEVHYLIKRAAEQLCSSHSIRVQKPLPPSKRRRHFRSIITHTVQVTTYFLRSDVTEITDLVKQGAIDIAWYRERQALNDQKHKWAEQCRVWHERRLADRGNEIKEVKDQRLTMVISKLRELGWEEELSHMSSVEPHPLFGLKQVKQLRPLTERAWLNMEEDAIAFMEMKKAERLGLEHYERVEERYALLQEFCHTLEFDFCSTLPSVRDIASIPLAKAILNSPDDVIVTEDSFQPLRDNLLEYVSEFQQAHKTMLREWIEGETGLHLSTDVDILDLAITRHITCNCGTKVMEENLFHADCSDGYRERERKSKKIKIDWLAEDAYEAALDKLTREYRWSTDSFKLHWGLVKHIINRAGEDPASVTTETMDQKKMRWYCADSNCHSDNARMIMTWKAAIRHILEEHPYCYGENFGKIIRVAKVAETKQVAALEMAAHYESGKYFCARCPTNVRMIFSEWDMDEHLKRWHGITTPKASDRRLKKKSQCSGEPFYIMVKPAKGSTKERTYKIAKIHLQGSDPRTVIGKLSSYK